VVVETMMAKNRENRYRNPDDLILDLKCLLQGESPMIAGAKPDDLATLSEGDSEIMNRAATEAQLVELAGYVNSRQHIIVALVAILALSVITNVVVLTTR
jgi:serine/threonine-protein kinase